VQGERRTDLERAAAHVVPVAGPPSFEKSQVNRGHGGCSGGHGVGDDDVGQVFGAVVRDREHQPGRTVRPSQINRGRGRVGIVPAASFFTIWILGLGVTVAL